ncbi:MAG: cation:proton antiporter [Gammaproteobacteria bacterium]
MNPGHAPLVTFAAALAIGVACQLLARHLRVPGILLLLLAGFLCGPGMFSLIAPAALHDGLVAIVELGMAVILFEGGLSLPPARLRRLEKPIRRLITLGAAITLAGATIAALLWVALPWRTALMLGSLVMVTGPTVVAPLLRTLRLRPRVKTILEAEGVLIDPIGAITAALALQIALAPAAGTALPAFATIGYQVGFGVGAGVIVGGVLGLLLRAHRAVPPAFHNILTLAVVWCLFAICEQLYPASGILAVTVAGVVVGFLHAGEARELREFKDQLTVALVGLLFILLTASIEPAELAALDWRAGALVVTLVLVVRPLAAWLSTAGTALDWRERVFIAAIAPRGIVAAAIATLSAEALLAAGVAGASQLRGLVFLTIAVTVALAALCALPLASLLGLRAPARERVALLGADGLGLVLGDFLARHGVPIVFVDADPAHVRAAEERGHAVVFGDPLDDRLLTRASFELVETVVAVTANEHLNRLFVRHAQESFDVPRAMIAVPPAAAGTGSGGRRKADVRVLFEAPHDIERWSVRLRHGDLLVEEFEFAKPATPGVADDVPKAAAQRPTELSVIVALQRGRRVFPMTTDLTPRPGDRALVALFDDEAERARDALARDGWRAPATDVVAPAGETPDTTPAPTPDIPLSQTIH